MNDYTGSENSDGSNRRRKLQRYLPVTSIPFLVRFKERITATVQMVIPDMIECGYNNSTTWILFDE